MAGLADQIGHEECDVAGAAADIENAHALSDTAIAKEARVIGSTRAAWIAKRRSSPSL